MPDHDNSDLGAAKSESERSSRGPGRVALAVNSDLGAAKSESERSSRGPGRVALAVNSDLGAAKSESERYGERGIRTPDRGLAYTRFPSVRLQPLGHLSKRS